MDLEPDYELEFSSELPGYLNAYEIADWFEKNANFFPDDFDWWFEKMKESGK
ncbi:MAG: hypothetical protein GF317_00950 [Candidatus Lokiarchaeota archaeon]|nr:hypothetical protein [Candidatus Lokiarchaeota archaeon]MBD3198526.1 hypothetical protein [Candidatus Lokiarchaeota archaeon]